MLRKVFLFFLLIAGVASVAGAAVVDRTAPVIARASHDGWRAVGFSGKLVAGDVLTVTVEGEKGCSAFFDIGLEIKDRAMEERSPGVYAGTYTVRWGDQGLELPVLARLRDPSGNEARLVAAGRSVSFDTRARLSVVPRKPLLPADSESETRLAVKVTNANGDDVAGHEVAITLSTVEDYTGVVGGGKLEGHSAESDEGKVEVRWGGVSDAFGEVTASYTAGYAAKTAMIIAKDLTTGDIGAGWLNTYVASTAAIQLVARAAKGTERRAVLRLAADPPTLTADGRSTARIRAWVSDRGGRALEGVRVQFEFAGENGALHVLRDRTDTRGLAEAEYRAGTVAGTVTISATAPDWAASSSLQVLLASDAPARIELAARPTQLPADGASIGAVGIRVTDAKGNANAGATVNLRVVEGSASLSAASIKTDRSGKGEAAIRAGSRPGSVVVEARYTSRQPTEAELRRVYGTVFVPRLYEHQERDRFKVKAWLVEPGEELKRGDPVVTIESRRGTWTLTAPEDGVFYRRLLAERDRAELGDTLGYVEVERDVWAREYRR